MTSTWHERTSGEEVLGFSQAPRIHLHTGGQGFLVPVYIPGTIMFIYCNLGNSMEFESHLQELGRRLDFTLMFKFHILHKHKLNAGCILLYSNNRPLMHAMLTCKSWKMWNVLHFYIYESIIVFCRHKQHSNVLHKGWWCLLHAPFNAEMSPKTMTF